MGSCGVSCDIAIRQTANLEFWKKDDLVKVKASLPVAKMERTVATESDSRRGRDCQEGVVADMGKRRNSFCQVYYTGV